MNTYDRHPRTLQEAFGPHTSREIEEPPEPKTLLDHVLNGLYWAFSLLLIAALLTAPQWWPTAAHP